MGSVKADIRELKKLRDKLQRMESNSGERDKFCEDCAKELAARLLRLLTGSKTGRTPVKTGTLRRGWTGGKSVGAQAFAESCKVYKNGDNYTIVVKNTVEYASYVEFGHRKRNGGWVPGQFFLTLSEEDLERIAPKVLKKKLETFLQGVFNGS